MNRITWIAAGAIAVGSLVVGCGSAAPSSGGANSAIRGADEVGAESQPQAAYHLQLARDQVAAAERMTANGDDVAAKRMLMRAQADAELAIALAGVGNDCADAQQLNQHISDMRSSQL